MVRLFNTFFPRRTLMLAVSESFLVLAALYISTRSFLSHGAGAEVHQRGLVNVFIASIVFLLCMYYYDLYDSPVLDNPREVKARLVQVVGTTSIILALMYSAYPVIELSRGTFFLGIFLVGASLAGWRELFIALNRSPRLAERAMFLGDGPLAIAIAEEIAKRHELGVRLVGYLGRASVSENSPCGITRLGDFADLPRVIEDQQIDRVIVTMTDGRGRLPVELLLKLKTRGVRIQDGADVYETVTGKVPLASLRLSWLLFSPGFSVSRSMRLYKRAVSILCSLAALLLLLPLMAVVAIAIRIDSDGPAIFRQKRMGKDGKVFTLFKFRSMRSGMNGESTFKAAEKNDDRVTRVGRWLRRSRLDELPQLYNVLRGDIDFVGPRPFVPEQELDLIEKIPFYTQRLTINPGVTGWAQVNRGYCATVEENVEKLAYDLFYIKNISVALDMLILFRTVKTMILGRGGR